MNRNGLPPELSQAFRSRTADRRRLRYWQRGSALLVLLCAVLALAGWLRPASPPELVRLPAPRPDTVTLARVDTVYREAIRWRTRTVRDTVVLPAPPPEIRYVNTGDSEQTPPARPGVSRANDGLGTLQDLLPIPHSDLR